MYVKVLGSYYTSLHPCGHNVVSHIHVPDTRHNWYNTRHYYWSISCSPQGDADRAVFGHTNYPYQLHFPTKISISADSSSLSLASFNVQQITVPYGEILGLMKDGVVKLGHLCRPKELLSGRVISSSLFSCEVAVDDIETLQQLLADIYNVRHTSYINCGC